MAGTPLIFLGAGASAPFDVPPMRDMVGLFEKELTEKGMDIQIDLWKDVKSRLESVYGLGNVDVEHMLTFFSFPYIDPSNLSPNVIYHYKIDTKELIQIIGTKNAKSIVEALKTFMYKSCDIEKHESIFPIYSQFWELLTQKVGLKKYAFYTLPDLEVFTTNYDRCFEIFYNIARNRLRSRREIILDEGVVRRYYNFDYYKTNYPRLYKLHGSIRRYLTKSGRVRLYDGLRSEGDSVNGDEVVEEWVIWPLRGKYIYQYPYSKLMDKFRTALYEKNTWLFIGFSFRDEGINMILKDVNDRLEDQMRRGQEVRRKNLVLIDRSADKKERLFEQYGMIFFYPVTGEFGKGETFGKVIKSSGHLSW